MEPHPLGAALLKQWREARGVFQTSIADALNIRQNTVSEWEKGSRRPDLPNALRLAHHTEGAVAATAWGYSPEDVARFAAHSAFEDPQSPANAPERESIEVRALVIY